MTESERQILNSLSRRLETLKRRTDNALEKNTYVPVVHALMGGLVIRTLILLCGQQLFTDLWHWLDGTLCKDAGLCKLCRTPKVKHTDIACQKCMEQMEEEEREADIDEALYDKPPQGSVS